MSRSKQNMAVLLFLVVLSLGIRLPFFFDIVIDWDESTYILMGQSMLDGKLPYTELWEMKPPLVFAFFAAVIALFGKSIIAVRLAGTLCVALTAFFIYLAGKNIWNSFIGLIGATLSIMASSLVLSGQAVMTEHIAMAPLMGALCLLNAPTPSLRRLFVVGMLMGTATFVRTNLACVAVIVGLFVVGDLYMETRRSPQRSISGGLAYASGGTLILLLVFLPYALTGNVRLWWISVILAPLSYAGAQYSFREAFERQFSHVTELLFLNSPLQGINIIVWFGGLLGLLAIIASVRQVPSETKRGSALLLLFLIATTTSLLVGGADYRHYLIQIIPFMALAAAALLGMFHSYRVKAVVTVGITFVVVMCFLSVVPKYREIIARIGSGKDLTYGRACEIAAYLSQQNPSGEPVYLMTDHIAYWLFDSQPLSKSTTHPSNISKEYILAVLIGPGATTASELERVLAIKPKFIVTMQDIWYLHNKPHARLLLKSILNAQYEVVNRIETSYIYRRR